MMLDPKGLEAAYDAGRDYVMEMDDRTKQMLRVSITAYLSTVTPAEVGGLVERLRYAENVAINDSHAAQTELSSTPAADNEYADNRAKLCAAVEETISLIQSQAARIAELEAGMEPFNAIAMAVFRDGMNGGKADAAAVWGFDNTMMTYGHLRAARSLLNGERKG